MELKSENPKAFGELDLKLKALEGVQGKVGWFESAKYADGTPVAYAATINELGSVKGKIPPRPFMRPAVTDGKQEWSEVAAQGARRVLDGKATPDTVMQMLTLKAQGDVSKKIAGVMAPPLSPITLGARKFRMMGKKVTGATIGQIARLLKQGKLDISGVSTKPLEDTGLMSATLTSVVENT